jgi:hypothetical protein
MRTSALLDKGSRFVDIVQIVLVLVAKSNQHKTRLNLPKSMARMLGGDDRRLRLGFEPGSFEDTPRPAWIL